MSSIALIQAGILHFKNSGKNGYKLECGDFWDRLGGQALVTIGWCVTNHTFERWKEKSNQNFDHSNT